MGQFELTLETLLIVALSGIGGWYLLLPRGRGVMTGPVWKVLGAAMATIGVALMAWAFGARLANTTNDLTFYALATVTIASAIAMISARNPVISALWFALVLLANSGLFLLQGAEFLSAATVIIYAGAIIVTFLFVIMLAQPRGSARYDNYSREPFLSCTAGVILCWTLLGTLHYSATVEAAPLETRELGQSDALPRPEIVAHYLATQPESRIDLTKPHVDSLGRTLFLEHYVSVEIIAMLLLVAVVGAVLIANRKRESTSS
ncbi:MAG: NADH:ubiquinone oxidoreductase subunit 6 [Planctomycetaceae bacterium]|nr:NADH:ubiquinone oxidoreductase subunit 6 [Planctomycetaceae bacterium]